MRSETRSDRSCSELGQGIEMYAGCGARAEASVVYEGGGEEQSSPRRPHLALIKPRP